MPDINVYAAASLTNALNEIRALYIRSRPGVGLTMTYGGSGALQQQIERGAAADVFLSAASSQIDALQSQGLLLPDTRRDLLGNQIALVVPIGSTGINSFRDLTAARVRRIAIGNPAAVPAGEYAQEVFASYGIKNQLRPKLTLYGDVRQVLAAVESGEADAGVVYVTDARVSTTTRIAAVAPRRTHTPIIYPVAVLRNSRNPEAARDFENFLFSSQARAVFEKYGFPAGTLTAPASQWLRGLQALSGAE